LKFKKICYVVTEFRNIYKELLCCFLMDGKRFLVIGLLGLFMISMMGVVAADITMLPDPGVAYDMGYADAISGLETRNYELEYGGTYDEGYAAGVANLAADDAASGRSDGEPGVSVGAGSSSSFAVWLGDKYNLWLKGIDWSSVSAEEQVDSVGQIVKWILLVLVVLLIYSGLSYSDFIESATVRFIVAAAAGFLGTFLITTRELLTILQSYTAMGIAFSVFLPILILGFFTLVVIAKAKPIGLFLQNILWIIYSVYLFARTGIYLVLKNAAANGELVAGTPYSIFGFVNIHVTDSVIRAVNAYSGSILMLLFITSIAIFVIMVLWNKPMRKWISEHLISSEADARRSKIKRADEVLKQDAERLNDQS